MTRVFPPADAARGTLTVFGRKYTCAAGSYLDVVDDDAAALGANGWTVLGLVGATAARPTSYLGDGTKPARGQLFYDTTLSKFIVYDGATWRDGSGTSV